MEDSKPKIKNTSDKYELFIHGFGLFRITLRLTGSQIYWRSGATAGYPVFEVNSPSMYRWIMPEMRV